VQHLAYAYAMATLGAYFLGSIPTGFLAGKMKGMDVRTLGSGNIGATNVFRSLGKLAGSVVLFLDALKGWLACIVLAPLAVKFVPPEILTDRIHVQLTITAGICAVLGHNFPCWLKFKGGKGIATSAGVLLAWVPVGLLVSLVTWLLVFIFSRYVSLASIAAALVLPFGVWLVHADRGMAYVWVTAGLSALALLKHRTNIQRLLQGTEHRFDPSKKAPSTASS